MAQQYSKQHYSYVQHQHHTAVAVAAALLMYVCAHVHIHVLPGMYVTVTKTTYGVIRFYVSSPSKSSNSALLLQHYYLLSTYTVAHSSSKQCSYTYSSRALISCCAVALAKHLARNYGLARQAPEGVLRATRLWAVSRVFFAGGEKQRRLFTSSPRAKKIFLGV